MQSGMKLEKEHGVEFIAEDPSKSIQYQHREVQ